MPSPEQATCHYCGEPFPLERLTEAGKNYCMSPDCAWKAKRDWADGYRLVLMPKVGFALVRVTDTQTLTTAGKSSGKT